MKRTVIQSSPPSTLRGVLDRLFNLLRRYFLPQGIPQTMPYWEIQTNREYDGLSASTDAILLNTELRDSLTFRTLAADEIQNDALAELLEKAPNLREFVEVLRSVNILLQTQKDTADRFIFLFNQLLDRRWLSKVGVVARLQYETKYFHSFTAFEIGREFLSDMQRGAETIPTAKPRRIGSKLAGAKRGRPKGSVNSNIDSDRRAWEAWEQSPHTKIDEYASEEHLDGDDLRKAIDRHKKRQSKSEIIPKHKHRQAK